MAALGKLSTQIYVSIVQATIQRKTGKFIENVEISSTAVTELPKTNGFMGQYYTLQVTIQPTDIGRTSDKTFVYFVKTLPLYNPSLVEIMRETGIADREHKTYTILMTALDGLSDGNSGNYNAGNLVFNMLFYHNYCNLFIQNRPVAGIHTAIFAMKICWSLSILVPMGTTMHPTNRISL